MLGRFAAPVREAPDASASAEARSSISYAALNAKARRPRPRPRRIRGSQARESRGLIIGIGGRKRAAEDYNCQGGHVTT